MKIRSTCGKIIVAFLLVIYIANPFKILLPYLNYNINYKYISTVLCENKAKPKMQCEGKCHLNKELKKAAEEESKNKEGILNLFELQEMLCQQFEYKTNHLIVIKNKIYSNYSERLYSSCLKQFSPPPQG